MVEEDHLLEAVENKMDIVPHTKSDRVLQVAILVVVLLNFTSLILILIGVYT